MLKILNKYSFLRHVMIVFSGSIVGQAAPIFVSPILTRQYKPEDFGTLSIFTAISGIFATVATCRYSYAVILPKENDQAKNLLLLSLMLSLAMSILAFFLLIIFKEIIFNYLGNRSLSYIIFLVPIYVFSNGSFMSLYAWFNRERRFKAMATARIAKGTAIAFFSLFFGFFSLGGVGLVFGFLAGNLTADFYFAYLLSKRDDPDFWRISLNELKKVAIRYRKFPLFSLPADFISTFARELPVLMFTSFFDKKILGFYSLTERVAAAPSGLVAMAIQDVFKERSAKDFANLGSCRDIYLKTAGILFAISVPTFCLFYFVAPDLFAIIFGNQWRTAGAYAQIITPLLIVRFITSPISYTIYIAEKQQYDLIWQSFLILIIYGSFRYGAATGQPITTIKLFSFSSAGMYIIYFFMSLKFTKKNRSNR